MGVSEGWEGRAASQGARGRGVNMRFQCRESVLEQNILAQNLHFNNKEMDTHENSHFSGRFLFLKELIISPAARTGRNSWNWPCNRAGEKRRVLLEGSPGNCDVDEFYHE